jgi:septal ring factor EnvC (AmiA/AmiB activator)
VRQDKYKAPLLAAFAAALALTPVTSAWTQDKRDLEKIEREIEVSQQQRKSLDQERLTLKQGVTTLRRNLIRAAGTAQEQESVLSQLEAKLPKLEKSAAERHRALNDRRRQMTGTLAALERLSRNPPQALLLSNAEPLKIVRSALLLRAALPHLRARAVALRQDLSEITTVRNKLKNRQRKIKFATATLETKRNRLNALMMHKAVEYRRMIKATRQVDNRLARLSERAESLRELFTHLQKAARPKPKPEPRRPQTASLPVAPIAKFNFGAMIQPARGKLVERFGQDTKTGSSAKGATFKTRLRAQVVAPFDGKVVFAGPFKGYGQILIIQHGDAYHTLLAGMRRVDAIFGQQLLAGEPIGVMGSQEAGTRFYVEVRRKGQPVNPLPWFTAARDKVRG